MPISRKRLAFNRVLHAVLAGAFLAAAIPMTAAAAMTDFSGHWVNADPAKSSIESVTVWSNEEGLQVQVSGCFASTPALLSEESACSWGAAKVQVFSGSMNANPASDARIITASFNAGFGQRQLVLHRIDGGGLGFEVLTHFTDGSRRSDFAVSGQLTRGNETLVPNISQ